MQDICHLFAPIIISVNIRPALIEIMYELLRERLICHMASSHITLSVIMWLHCAEFKIDADSRINHGLYL